MRIATRYLVRSMQLADVPQVMEIERESFPTMWPPTAFKRELQQNRLASYIVVVERNPELGPENGPGPEPRQGVGRLLRSILRQDEGSPLPPPERRPELVLGFAGVWMLPDEAHLVTIAVRESRRRRGIGEQLLISTLELAQQEGESMVTLECRVSNGPALDLYEKYRFQQVGLRPRYYSDNHEDAYILTVSPILSSSYRAFLAGRKAEHARRHGGFETDLD